MQALDYVGTQRSNLVVGWSELHGALRLKISFCTGSPGFVRISSFFKHVIRKASPKMCAQTRVRRIDELLVGQIDRNLGFVGPDQRDDHLLAHQAGGVDLRLAPARRQPLRRDECQNHLAAIGGLLQGVLPALAGDDAALGVEIEEDVGPAVGREPVADLDRLVVVPARMTDKNMRHGRKTLLRLWRGPGGVNGWCGSVRLGFG